MQFRIRFIKSIENHEDLAYGIIWSFIEENLKNENDSSLSETTEKKKHYKTKTSTRYLDNYTSGLLVIVFVFDPCLDSKELP